MSPVRDFDDAQLPVWIANAAQGRKAGVAVGEHAGRRRRVGRMVVELDGYVAAQVARPDETRRVKRHQRPDRRRGPILEVPRPVLLPLSGQQTRGDGNLVERRAQANAERGGGCGREERRWIGRAKARHHVRRAEYGAIGDDAGEPDSGQAPEVEVDLERFLRFERPIQPVAADRASRRRGEQLASQRHGLHLQLRRRRNVELGDGDVVGVPDDRRAPAAHPAVFRVDFDVQIQAGVDRLRPPGRRDSIHGHGWRPRQHPSPAHQPDDHAAPTPCSDRGCEAATYLLDRRRSQEVGPREERDAQPGPMDSECQVWTEIGTVATDVRPGIDGRAETQQVVVEGKIDSDVGHAGRRRGDPTPRDRAVEADRKNGQVAGIPAKVEDQAMAIDGPLDVGLAARKLVDDGNRSREEKGNQHRHDDGDGLSR